MKADRAAIWISILLFSALSIWMAVASKGFLEADDITHYLARRFALDRPVHFVGVWNRPLCVILYCIPAKIGGVLATRFMTLGLVMLTLWLTILIAKELKIARASLVTIFFLSQPLLFAHSFAALTEIPFAMLLAGMMYAYIRKWPALLAALAAISPLARPEGFGILFLVAITLLCHRKWYWIALLPLGITIWSVAGWVLYGRPTDYAWYTWLAHNWPYSPESAYGARTPSWQKPGYFIAILPAIIGPFAFPLIWIGAYQLLSIKSKWVPLPGSPSSGRDEIPKSDSSLPRLDLPSNGTLDYSQSTGRYLSDHPARCRVFVALIPLGILIVHSLLWTFGKMASNGEPRYMLIAAPFWAILAAQGWTWVSEYLKLKNPLRWPVLGVIAVLIANRSYPCFPLGIYPDDQLAGKVCDWLKAQSDLKADYPRLSASLPQVFMQLDIDPIDKSRVVTSSKPTASNPPAGVILVWDDIYSQTNSNREYCISREDLIAGGWQPIHMISVGNRESVIFISPENIAGIPTKLPTR